ncbi:phosphoribosylformimino-5-aminoimidazole carboxamide ribotide isomerase [Desulfofarcimen acetoxidans DSM 771]|uniref:1-(5-phosphoribosyl)-5-[(5-phosphoribosylamino)methylideneamino] imidazole-4-carboxamide isomerase n=1 Tax=Desulfofarcimen acetoxidans (strain ATCC 49208 / DSM 771 / KCTC 5769 / VKM B-1644 / 5575) TaxID=485916 RepID=C8W202_DESAS|nr:1-(5-phosphoribosyl)-5-[(5-phosphoribosylamino)methylideneamino]imidazole-4-carboxamide isomerase [Desulfofarcimen acetoxidans]ACV61666.1 phosphoribosylformimino-5-aminoimidazole carboxamide ribotide isomerase [Desulfofarcimen acetoxidans DSM 771]
MLIIPAIDLREGRCVRLVEGRLDQETIYSDDPVAMALSWQQQGAEYLHVVDLDGAFAGAPKNLAIIKNIIAAVDIPVEVGGGIRNLEAIEELLGSGASRVVLGTVAIRNPELVQEACQKFGEGIVVGIDAKNGKVAIQGWGITVEKTALELALEMKKLGVQRVLFTDIKRDGTLQGPNLEATGDLARKSGLKVIASGGVSVLEDLKELKKLEADGVDSVIMGKALYAGTIKLKDALALAEAK